MSIIKIEFMYFIHIVVFIPYAHHFNNYFINNYETIP